MKHPADGNIKISDKVERLINLDAFLESKDRKGHSTSMAFRGPDWMVRMAGELRSISGSPYFTNSDVFRDAAYVGLLVLGLRYGCSNLWHIEAILHEASLKSSNAARIRETISALGNGVDSYYSSGDKEHATLMIKNFIRSITQFGDEAYRRLYWKEMQSNPTIMGIARESNIRIPPQTEELLTDEED